MKNYIFPLICILILGVTSCSTQNYLDSKTFSELVGNEEFTFMAKRAIPTNYDVVNVANSLPGYSSSRLFDLDYGYSIILKKDELVSMLPYFGRAYNISLDPNKQGYRFTSKNFTISKSTGKKNSRIVLIQPKDVNYVNRIIMEIYPNGSAYVSIDSNDRQPISYSGYLIKNEVK